MRFGIGVGMVLADTIVFFLVVACPCPPRVGSTINGMEARTALDPCWLALGHGAAIHP